MEDKHVKLVQETVKQLRTFSRNCLIQIKENDLAFANYRKPRTLKQIEEQGEYFTDSELGIKPPHRFRAKTIKLTNYI